jgi:pimeloyl-ACP methyl ester carboxylesterase
MKLVARWMLAVLCIAALAVVPSRADEPVAQGQKWPARRAVEGGGYGIVRELPAPHGLRSYRQNGPIAVPLRGVEREMAEALVGAEGLERAEAGSSGSFLFQPVRAEGAAPQPGPRHLVFMSATSGDRTSIRRTWFAVLEPEGEVRGAALLMPGLFGTPEPVLKLFTTRLRAEGWVVVRMMAQPSNFTDRRMFELSAALDLKQIAEFARDADDRAAECAYAVEAVFKFLEGETPALADRARIAVGMSGGAMTLPTVVAREPGRYAAAVMIAGGCDFLALTNETNYTMLVDAVRVQWTPEDPTPEQYRAIDGAYLAAVTLDSYHTALAMRGKPMLMIHGEYDAAVPSRLGDLLWERLGKPERWSEPAGHEEVFIKLPPRMDKIMEWVRAAAAVGPESGR